MCQQIIKLPGHLITRRVSECSCWRESPSPSVCMFTVSPFAKLRAFFTLQYKAEENPNCLVFYLLLWCSNNLLESGVLLVLPCCHFLHRNNSWGGVISLFLSLCVHRIFHVKQQKWGINTPCLSHERLSWEGRSLSSPPSSNVSTLFLVAIPCISYGCGQHELVLGTLLLDINEHTGELGLSF